MTDAVVTLSGTDYRRVLVSLDKAVSVPVTFDWRGVSGSSGGGGSGTYTIPAGTTSGQIDLQLSGSDWNGGCVYFLEAQNLKNAVFSNGKQVTTVTNIYNRNDTITYRTVEDLADPASTTNDPYTVVVSTNNSGTWLYGKPGYPNIYKNSYRMVIRTDKEVTGKITVCLLGGKLKIFTNEITPENITYGKLTGNYNDSLDPSEGSNAIYTSEVEFTRDESSATPRYTAWLSPETLGFDVAEAQWESYDWDLNPGVVVRLPDDTSTNVIGIGIEKNQALTDVQVTNIRVPSGAYYSGQQVPVTATFSEYMENSGDGTMTINGEECPIAAGSGGISKKITFLYTVKDVDTGSLAVSDLSGTFKNGQGVAVNINGFTEATFGAAQGVFIRTDIKRISIDNANAKFGIDNGESGEQLVTALVPFKSDASLNWVGSESVDIDNGKGLTMSLPGYPSALIRDYIAGAYFSYDGGKTRYPAYVVRSTDGYEKPIALAARFAAPPNDTVYLRRDKLELFIETAIVTDPEALMCNWDNMQTDLQGFAYTTATSNYADGLIVSGSYYVKGGVFFSQDEYVSRGEADYSSAVENGFLKLNDGYYVQLADHSDHPERRHDVEIVVSESFYKADVNAAHLEDSNNMTLDYQFSDRKRFSFVRPGYFMWKSSNEEVATLSTEIVDNRTVATVHLTGKLGTAEITLNVDNGGMSFDLYAGSLVVMEGMTPYFNIPSYSKNRTTLTDTDTSIMVSTNLRERNASFSAEDTKYSIELYNSSNTKVWSDECITNLSFTHFTIPGSVLTDPGTYTVKVCGEYYGDEPDYMPGITDSTTLTVRQAPVRISLNKLESYYVTSDEVPSELGYTVNNQNATVQYTIQRSGQAVSEMKTPSDGVIPFSAGKPSGLKDVYTVTVYACNEGDEDWSVDSMLLTVYNKDVLDVVVADVLSGEIGGTTGGTGESVKDKTVVMNNAQKAQGYVNESGYQLTYEDFTALRTDISLQKVVSANYGEGIWGMLSDRIKWESDDPDLVSINYEQGGMYSDIRNYSYTSYAPATDFLIVGKGDTKDNVTITATHANTGTKASFQVKAETLRDQLYLFQFYPKTTTTVMYKNGDGVSRRITSNDQGELAVYEPSGIASDVQTMSTYASEDDPSVMDTYVGTALQKNLESGERDIASLQLYACNNLRLRKINKVTMVFRNTNGSPYNGEVTIHGGVFKNDIYCPSAMIRTSRTGEYINGRDGFTVNISNGKLELYFDPTTFRNDSGNDQLLPGDSVAYVMEYKIKDCRPGVAMIYSYSNSTGLVRDSNAVIQLNDLRGGANTPQIITQSMQQYYLEDGKASPTAYARDLLNYTEYIGLSRQISQVVLSTEIALMNEAVNKDDNGYSTFSSDSAYHFALCDTNGKEMTDAVTEGGAQPRNAATIATQITDLMDLANSTLYVYPFSTFAVARGSYTMNDASLTSDGVTDGGSEENFSTTNSKTGVKMVYYYGEKSIKSERLPFGISNLSHQPDITVSTKEMGTEIKSDVQSKADIGNIFGSVDVNDMIRKGIVFLGGLSGKGSDKMMNMLILPTEDPSSFRIMVFIGYNKRQQESEEGKLNVEFDPDQLYDDAEKFDQALSDMFKDDDDDDDDDGGEGSIDLNFYGTLLLDAHLGGKDGEWGISFAGGNVGANFAIGYEWSQTFMCGPIPFLISFNVGAHADLELGFASISDVREMLFDAALGVSIEAFAGIGFDMSLIAFQLGIFGKIGADVNFLFLTRTDQSGSTTTANGTKLDITGEIGLRMKVKIVLVEYSKTFCSTKFNWSKTWGKYNEILNAWESGSPAEIRGTTTRGRAYKMMLYPTGEAVVAVDGQGEIESRDYLEQGERTWNDGKPAMRRSLSKSSPTRSGSMTNVQTNAYPYSDPVFTDDGEMFLYLSDNNSKDQQSVVSYAVKNGEGYNDQGKLDVTDNVLLDSNVSASGAGSNVFAAWVKQQEKPVHENNNSTSVGYDDLGIMLNSTEIYAGNYNGSEWNVTRLTENSNADMSPVVASSGNRAIVAWRSLDTARMPETKLAPTTEVLGSATIQNMSTVTDLPKNFLKVDEEIARRWKYDRLYDTYLIYGYDESGNGLKAIRFNSNVAYETVTISDLQQLNDLKSSKSLAYVTGVEAAADNDVPDLSAMFSVENTLRYRIYNGTEWTDAQLAYNGSAGTVTAVDAAMLSDGTALLTYTVRTGDDLTSTETFYTAVDSMGKVLTTARLTNNNNTDTNAKVVALGDRFVLGWYSEPDSGKNDGSVTHDVRLALVNANGSVDADFPECIGSDTPIGSAFSFTQPVGNDDINKLSIIWSQDADSTNADNESKYELDAVRFYQQGDTVGVSSPTQISLTDKLFTIDHFDAYTDADGIIHTLVLGSDYNDVKGMEVYDTISTTDLPVYNQYEFPAENTQDLQILSQNTLSCIKLGSGGFAPTDIEVSADTDLKALTLGLNQPIQFTVKNTGTNKINKITVSGAVDKEFTDLELLPNETKMLTVNYPVPEDSVKDITFTVTPEGGEEKTVNVTLNRPDVGIAGMKILREENGERDVQVTLANASGIPLAGSGKTVKVGLFKDRDHKEQLELITISSDSDLADIDAGFYSAACTIDVTQLVGSGEEIPENGIKLFVGAWIEDEEDLYPQNNNDIILFHGLLSKNNGEIFTENVSFETSEDGYIVNADIRNNSLLNHTLSTPKALLLDSEGSVLAYKELKLDHMTFNKEELLSAEPLTFTFDEVSGTPASVKLGFISNVTFDAAGGIVGGNDSVTVETNNFGKISTLPVLDKLQPGMDSFTGWYLEEQDLSDLTKTYTKVDENTIFTHDTTVYAHYASDPVNYREAHFDEETQKVVYENKTIAGIPASTSSTWTSGWYVAKTDFTFDERVNVQGDVNLILCDGVTLNASQGIELSEGNTLRIYSQTEGTGKLIANYDKSGYYACAIGNNTVLEYGGTIYLHGGKVNATASASYCTGIIAQEVVVYGGELTAVGTKCYGIGTHYGSSYNGRVTIYDGRVTASSNSGDSASDAIAQGGTLILGPDINIVDSEKILVDANDTLWTLPADAPRASYMKTMHSDEMQEAVSYMDQGEEQSVTLYTELDSAMNEWADGQWYVVRDTVTISDRISVDGSVNLILTDGSELIAENGIEVEDYNRDKLSIYVQKKGTGKLTAAVGEDTPKYAAIGSNGENDKIGEINIYGGEIHATGGKEAPGIGACDLYKGKLNIYGGKTVAIAGKDYDKAVSDDLTISLDSELKLLYGDSPEPEIFGKKASDDDISYGRFDGKYVTIAADSDKTYVPTVALLTSDMVEGMSSLADMPDDFRKVNEEIANRWKGDGSSATVYLIFGENEFGDLISIELNNGENYGTRSFYDKEGLQRFLDRGDKLYYVTGVEEYVDPDWKTVPTAAPLTLAMVEQMSSLSDMPTDFEEISSDIAKLWPEDDASSDKFTYLIYAVENGHLKVAKYNMSGTYLFDDSINDLGSLKWCYNNGYNVYYVNGTTKVYDPEHGDDPGHGDDPEPQGRWRYFVNQSESSIEAIWEGSNPPVSDRQILKVTMASGPVTGEPYTATCDNSQWRLDPPTITYYRLENQDDTVGTRLDSAPSEKGFYYVEVTVDSSTLRKTFAIGYEMLTITGAELETRDYEPGNSSAKVLSVSFDKAQLVMDVDYEVTEVYVQSTAGENVPVTITIRLLNENYVLSSNEYYAHMTINKIAYTGLTQSSVLISAAQGSNTQAELPISGREIDNAEITNDYSDIVNVQFYGGNYIGISTNTQIESTDPMTITIHYTSYVREDFDYTLTLIPTTKQIPIIWVYGAPESMSVEETGGALNVGKEGDGEISFSVLQGYEEYIDIDPATGAITAKKAGTAYYCVTSAETDTCAEYTLIKTIIIKNDDRQKQIITASDITANYGDAGLKINASTNGDGQLGYSVNSYNVVSVDSQGNITVYGTGTAIVTITAQETATFKKATKEVTVTINKNTYTGLTELTVEICSEQWSYRSVELPFPGKSIKEAQITNNYSDYVNVMFNGNNYIGISTDTKIESTDTMTVTIHYVSDGYEDFDFTLNLVPVAKKIATLDVWNLTVALEVGQTSGAPSVDNWGDGAVSFSVLQGYEEYIDINSATGAITAKKAGKAYYCVISAETDTYAEKTQVYMITITGGEDPSGENEYTVTFKDGENILSTVTGVSGTAVTAPEAPQKAGFRFVGWDKDVPETIPAEDVVINAVWEEIKDIENISTISADTLEAGRSLTVNAAAQYGEGSYRFAVYYKLSTDTAWSVALKYGANSKANIRLRYACEYMVCVKVKDSAGREAKKYFNVTAVEPNFANTSTLSADIIKPGETFTVNASAQNGTGSYTYAVYYKLKSASSWNAALKYGTKSTVKIRLADAGKYEVCAKVKDSTGAEVKKYFTVIASDKFVINAKVSSAIVKPGEWLFVSSTAGNGTPEYTYAVYYRLKTDPDWSVAHAYGDASEVSFRLMDVGEYEVCAKAKDSKGKEVKKYFDVTTQYTNTSTLSADIIKPGETFTVNASVENGKGDCTYAVYYKLKSASSWNTALKYGTKSTVNIKLADAGEYEVCAKVKDSTGAEVKNYFTVIVSDSFAINAKISSASVSAGDRITVSSTAGNGTPEYTYAVYYKLKMASSWSVALKYGNASEGSFIPADAGEYQVCAKAKDSTGKEVKKYFDVTVS